MELHHIETINILQEECAEVIQAVSKIHRFGLDGDKPNTTQTNREHLEEELGDMLAMVDILSENGIIDYSKVEHYKRAKIDKLKTWSSIPNLDKI